LPGVIAGDTIAAAMLRQLDVRDLGIIDALHLELCAGFTVLTGETGAGKSLLVQSLQLLAGERGDTEAVRGGADRLVVEGRFDEPTAPAARTLLEELGAAVADELVVRREVSAQGRSRAWVNDAAVTVGALQRLAPHLLAVHGQHEQRGLADPATHLALVDVAGDLEGLRARVANAFVRWAQVRSELAEQRRALAARRDRLDVIEFQVHEIDAARPLADEEEGLREERALLRHAERIGELLAGARAALGGDGGAVALARAARAVRELLALDLPVRELAESLEQAQVLAEDGEHELERLADRVRFDPPRLETVEERLALLERLARKYGGSVAAVIAHRDHLVGERRALEGAEDEIARLEEEERALAATYLAVAQELSLRRAEAAKRFAREVARVLATLGMPKVSFALRLAPRLAADGELEVAGERVAAAADGIDIGELWISSNPGEPARPMVRIASGGELSRIHLAIRTVLRERRREDSLTLLFDEVDAGIGGQVADELGALLASLGERDQVLVVTHLPQVAARAGGHFVVRKQAAGGRTVTRVETVAGDGRVDELVRMLGGAGTAAARAHARELLRRA
jgi:DNA repair protein RecN (Recombination protein N)